MRVEKTYRFIGLDSFTLVLATNTYCGNELKTSIPKTYLRANLDAHLKQLRYAYIPSQELAFDWLDRTARKIFKLKDSYKYFFKVYLQKNKAIHRDIADYIITNIEDPLLQPQTHYSVNNRPVDFFILNSNVLGEWNIYKNSIREISVGEFKTSLLNNEMKKDFTSLIEENCKAYIIKRGQNFTVYFLFTPCGRLLMVVNH
jgi:hypothetical protein